MRNSRRTVKAIACVLVLLTLLSACLSIVADGVFHAHHCPGEKCEICMTFSHIYDALDGFLPVTCIVCLSDLIVWIWRHVRKVKPIDIFSNLVSLKVKLSD